MAYLKKIFLIGGGGHSNSIYDLIESAKKYKNPGKDKIISKNKTYKKFVLFVSSIFRIKKGKKIT